MAVMNWGGEVFLKPAGSFPMGVNSYRDHLSTTPELLATPCGEENTALSFLLSSLKHISLRAESP